MLCSCLGFALMSLLSLKHVNVCNPTCSANESSKGPEYVSDKMCGVLQASIGQLTEAHMLFGDYIAAFSHFGWIPEQVSVLLNQVTAPSCKTV